MNAILNIDTKEADKKLNLVNKNFYLIIIIVFGLCIFYLFNEFLKLNNKLSDILQNQNIETVKVIDNNNSVIENNTKSLDKLTEAITTKKKHYQNELNTN